MHTGELSAESVDYVEEPLKHQALRPHFSPWVSGGGRVGGGLGGDGVGGGVGGCWGAWAVGCMVCW